MIISVAGIALIHLFPASHSVRPHKVFEGKTWWKLPCGFDRNFRHLSFFPHAGGLDPWPGAVSPFWLPTIMMPPIYSLSGSAQFASWWSCFGLTLTFNIVWPHLWLTQKWMWRCPKRLFWDLLQIRGSVKIHTFELLSESSHLRNLLVVIWV